MSDVKSVIYDYIDSVVKLTLSTTIWCLSARVPGCGELRENVPPVLNLSM